MIWLKLLNGVVSLCYMDVIFNVVELMVDNVWFIVEIIGVGIFLWVLVIMMFYSDVV